MIKFHKYVNIMNFSSVIVGLPW